MDQFRIYQKQVINGCFQTSEEKLIELKEKQIKERSKCALSKRNPLKSKLHFF